MENFEKIKSYYKDKINTYGQSARGVSWNNEQSQDLRFEKLSEVIRNKNIPLSVNDFGCGYGALYQFLSRKSYQINRYNGYDICDSMLTNAQQTIGINDRVNLVNSPSITHRADYSFVSGVFNLMFDCEEKKWHQYILKILEDLSQNSTKGFAFNSLSSYVDYKDKGRYYGDPTFYFDYCKTRFSKKVTLLHDYDLWEWTIYVLKE